MRNRRNAAKLRDVILVVISCALLAGAVAALAAAFGCGGATMAGAEISGADSATADAPAVPRVAHWTCRGLRGEPFGLAIEVELTEPGRLQVEVLDWDGGIRARFDQDDTAPARVVRFGGEDLPADDWTTLPAGAMPKMIRMITLRTYRPDWDHGAPLHERARHTCFIVRQGEPVNISLSREFGLDQGEKK